MAKAKKPNILVIWGDDIGITNLSCYTHGLMGYQTPNIDRLAKEGVMFIDCYGEQILHRRPVLLHHRAECISHRFVEGRHAGGACRHAGGIVTIAALPQKPGLRNGSIRQEPSWRLEQVPPDRAWIR